MTEILQKIFGEIATRASPVLDLLQQTCTFKSLEDTSLYEKEAIRVRDVLRLRPHSAFHLNA